MRGAVGIIMEILMTMLIIIRVIQIITIIIIIIIFLIFSKIQNFPKCKIFNFSKIPIVNIIN